MTQNVSYENLVAARERARNALTNARDAYEMAKATFEDYDRAVRDADRALALDQALTGSLHCSTPGFKGTAEYILPLGRDYAGINPLDPATFPFGGPEWAANGIAYILSKPERTRPTRLVFSTGGQLSNDWGIGATWRCNHDQTGAYLGTYTVVGIVIYDGAGNIARYEGEVPNRRISGAVFK